MKWNDLEATVDEAISIKMCVSSIAGPFMP